MTASKNSSWNCSRREWNKEAEPWRLLFDFVLLGWGVCVKTLHTTYNPLFSLTPFSPPLPHFSLFSLTSQLPSCKVGGEHHCA